MDYSDAMNKYPEIEEMVALIGRPYWDLANEEMYLYKRKGRGEILFLVIDGCLYEAHRGSFGKWLNFGIDEKTCQDTIGGRKRRKFAHYYMETLERNDIKILPRTAIISCDLSDVMYKIKRSIALRHMEELEEEEKFRVLDEVAAMEEEEEAVDEDEEYRKEMEEEWEAVQREQNSYYLGTRL